MILHNQNIDISENIKVFDSHLYNLGYPHHAIHTGPLIRRESVYSNDLVEERKRLFNALFNFARRLDFQYSCIKVKKSECPDVITMTSKVSKALADVLRSNEGFWNSFDKVIIYYDNGQIELTKILTSVFSTLYTHVEFRKVKPVDYKLFQIADLICTMELLAEKADTNSFSRSEMEFFDNWILWCGNTANPAGRKPPVRTNGNRLCEFIRVMLCLIHIPHALRCHVQRQCL